MSKIFSNTELESIEKIQSGDRADKGSVFYNRAKPKIIELLEKWFPKKRELEKLVEPKRKKVE